MPGQTSNLTFSGTQSAYITLAFSAVTLSTSTVTVFNPDATVLMTLPLTTSGVQFSPQLPQTGTYTVSVVPKGAISGGFTAALTSGPTATLTANGSPYSLTLTNQTPTQLPFNGVAGEDYSLFANATSGTINTLSVAVLAPNGSTVSNATWQACSACRGSMLSFGPLTESGSYTAIIQENSAPSTATLSVALATPVTGTAVVGMPTNSTVNILGQGVEESFSGTAGQYLSAAFSSAWYITSGSISILGVDGTVLSQQNFTGSCGGYPCDASGVVNAGPLPSTGTDKALIQQTPSSAASTGAVTFTIDLASQGALTLGTATTIPVAFGQGLQQTFVGSAGQDISIALDSVHRVRPAVPSVCWIPIGQTITTAPFAGDILRIAM